MENPKKPNEREERIIKRASNPKMDIEEYFRTTDFTDEISNHKRIMKEIINNPFKKYKEFKQRLTLNGADAEFPELAGCFYYLVKSLYQNPEIYTFFKTPQYKILLEQLLNKLIGVEIHERFKFPYRATIYCIESILELIDFYYRNTWKDDTKLLANEKIGEYYHIFRYRSYLTTFTDSKYGIPNNIIFPTFYNIGATDLIKLRCVPILIMGITNESVYIDQYLNTPLDFWAHDIQHSKRQIQETLRYYDLFIKHNQYYQRRTLYNIRSEDSFYEYMEKFTKEIIIPILQINPEDDERTRAYKQIKKIIIFEIVHEKAWPLTKKSLCRNLVLRYDEFPVENIKYDRDNGKISTFHYLFADPTTIGNVVGKLRNGFYDKTNEVNDKICKLEYRTSEHIARATEELLNEINCNPKPSFNYILALAKDRHAMQEYEDMPTIAFPDTPLEPIDYPDEPIENIYSDENLFTKFVAKANIQSQLEQDSLHKSDEVVGYNPTYEMLGGYQKKYLKYKEKYMKLKKHK